VWSSLKGAAREGAIVAEVLSVEPVTGEAATAEALLSVSSPRYLHIATHGVYCDPESFDKKNSHPVLSRLAKNPDPMERSALVMAVTDAAAVQADGNPKAAGIVTAGELCTLDLRGTALVVLSACDSGRGAPVPLDGTHGLRRAFRAAGASCVIGTFWPVDDKTTPGLMKSLYALLEAGLPPHRALQEAARALKKVHREPYFWAPFFTYGISKMEP
jgi:CHAT domain-containing protein